MQGLARREAGSNVAGTSVLPNSSGQMNILFTDPCGIRVFSTGIITLLLGRTPGSGRGVLLTLPLILLLMVGFT